MDSAENQSELFLLSAPSRSDLAESLSTLAAVAANGGDLHDLASTCFQNLTQDFPRVAIIASSPDELVSKVERVIGKLNDGSPKINDTSGIYFTEDPIGLNHPKIGFLFPGEGSQYPGMLSDLEDKFPIVRQILDFFEDRNDNSAHDERSIGRFFQSTESLSDEELAEVREDLKRIDHAMFAILMADWMMYNIVSQLGIRPDTISGHSAGELVALMVSGILTGPDEQFAILCDGFRDLGKHRPEGAPESKLLALGKSADFAAEVIEQAGLENGQPVQAFVAMKNCPHQSVIVGTKEAVEKVEKVISSRGVVAQPLYIEQPYHTPLFSPYMDSLRKMFEPLSFETVNFPVYSCTTAEIFPDDPEIIFELTASHWESPVEFIQLIENQYRDGVRCFIEIGPRNHLCSFTEDILRGKNDVIVIPSNTERNGGIAQLQHLSGRLFVHGFDVDPSLFYSQESEPHHLEEMISAQQQIPQGGSREEIMSAHLRLMEDFLHLHEEVMGSYLSGQPAPEIKTESSVPAPAATPPSYPLIDEVTSYEPNANIVTRRSMILHEDIFSDQHTVGGRELSAVKPNQCGLPVVPMTFSIEMLAETAMMLCPGMVVSAMSKVKLYKWLDYSDNDIATAQVTAELDFENSSSDLYLVKANLYHCKDEEEIDLRRPAATAVIEMQHGFSAAPSAGDYSVINERPCGVTIQQLYQNLFHGEEFQGVVEFGKFGDDGIEADIKALPRERLLRSNPDPQFVFDPVMLDVALHPMCAWHLEQEDQSGRILLPIGVDRIEFYGNLPEPETHFLSRAKMLKETSRQFTQEVDIVDETGHIWCSMKGSHYWRFYLPFRKFNFHGPKNVYMLSLDFDIPSEIGIAKILDVPDDLRSPTMQPIGARVTLSDDELAEFKKLDVPAERQTQWLFGRITAKETVREKWRDMTGEMLFTADVEIDHDESGRPFAKMRGRNTPENFPSVSLSHCENHIIAIASEQSCVGIDIEKIEKREKAFISIAFSPDEISLLNQTEDFDEWATRFWSAKESVGKALGQGLEEGPRSVEVVKADWKSGVVEVALKEKLSDTFPKFRDKPMKVYTSASDGMAHAYTICETSAEIPVTQAL